MIGDFQVRAAESAGRLLAVRLALSQQREGVLGVGKVRGFQEQVGLELFMPIYIKTVLFQNTIKSQNNY